MRISMWIALAFGSFLLVGCRRGPTEALAVAASHGDLPEMDRLLAAGASGDIPAALIWAARSGQPAAIDYLVKRGGDPNETGGVNGWTVLMHAVHKDQPRSVAALLRDGANVNAQTSGGQTALIMAAGYGYTEIVRMLMMHNADPRLTTDSGENALDRAASGVTDIDRFTYGSCQVETVRVLRQFAPDLRPAKGDLKKCG